MPEIVTQRFENILRIQFNRPEKKNALGTSYWLPAQIGYLAAAELVLLALPFDARRAAELGLVTRVVAEADLMATALDTAHRLTRQPAGAVRASKRLMKRALGAQMTAAAELEFREYASRLQSDEAKEAFTAFFEKRKPDFTKIKATAGGPLQ